MYRIWPYVKTPLVIWTTGQRSLKSPIEVYPTPIEPSYPSKFIKITFHSSPLKINVAHQDQYISHIKVHHCIAVVNFVDS